jgi:3-deoxy-D-manno-octulosonic-acid transferase
MGILYNIGLRIYTFLVFIASPFHVKAKKWRDGRKDIFQKIQEKIKGGETIVWFHSASLGEFEQGRPVIEEIKKNNPNVKILVTFFSPSGYEIRKNYKNADYIFYLPVDYKRNARKFIEIVKPAAVYFIKYEFWHNYIVELHKKNIPIFCISANFRKNQLFFKSYGGWYRNMLKCFTHIFVQNEQSEILLNSIGITCVTVTGDTRFDRVNQIASQAKHLPIVDAFSRGSKVIVAGSTWPADESLIVQFINETNSGCKFIIAPHEIHSEEINKLVLSINRKVLKYSEAESSNPANFDVLVIDNIGMLSSVYQYGAISYIGGGFGKGIHNILEAATFGLPVFFGPNYMKFQEAIDLVNLGGSFTVDEFSKLKLGFDSLLNDAEQLNKAANECKNYVAKNIGATEKILKITSNYHSN